MAVQQFLFNRGCAWRRRLSWAETGGLRLLSGRAAGPASLWELLSGQRASRGRSGPLIGTWNMSGSADISEVLAAAGMRFVCIDMEHSGMSLSDVLSNIRACESFSCATAVRVPSLDPKTIMRVLDLGASAVIVPGMRNAEEVRTALEAARFPPAMGSPGSLEGSRGGNPFVRANKHGTGLPSEYHSRSNRDCLVIPQLESGPAIEAMEEIVQVPGLRAVSFGPFDLSVSLGHDGTRSPEVDELLLSGVRAAVRAGVIPILPVLESTAESTSQRVQIMMEEGVGCFTVGVDKALLRLAAVSFLSAMKR